MRGKLHPSQTGLSFLRRGQKAPAGLESAIKAPPAAGGTTMDVSARG